MSGSAVILATLIVYKLLLLWIGWRASRQVDDARDFFLAGQDLGAWTAGLSYAASTSSAWVLLGFTGAVFSQGLVALWLLPGIFGGYVMTWLVMGPRLNAETAAKGHVTIVDFLRDGAGTAGRLIGAVSALMILFCFVFYIASQFQAAGNAFTSVFAMSGTEAILLGAAVIVIYCLFGGFRAASITDALQAGVMMAACIMVPMAAFFAAGGLSGLRSGLASHVSPEWFSLTGGALGMAGIGAAMGLLGTGLGALGQPQLLNRIMAVKSDAERKRAAMITIGWGVVIYTGLVVLALSARAMNMETGGESLFFAAAGQFLPAILAGVVVAAVLSAVMSTVDSLLLAAASAISHDMGFAYRSPERALLAGRVAMVVVAVCAVLLTLYMPKDIFSRVLFAWVALGAAFGPTLLTRCLGMRVNGYVTAGAIISGFLIAVIASGLPGTGADIIEKWGSWAAGLAILGVGRLLTGAVDN